MDIWTAMKTRRSVRSYTGEPVSEEAVRAMLEAAMLAPSAGNEQPWEFILVRDKEALVRAGGINPYASFSPKASLGVMICLNREREKYAGMGFLDIAACTQNLLLAAHGLGLGAVWTAVYPVEERVKGFRALLALPENVIPVAFVLVGHPGEKSSSVAARFDEGRIHNEAWGNRGL
ncbi:nitroreductase family protein [Mailhella massiliensis]|uniref:Nitroreductase family protein n=1 Tax=Mailhella massiliensis TaxID=1903261 RepID=A0A921AWE7_9BACT|nr:nitroreductase family protein [Mailhella massiliensis]HJD97094.1 nitroreductase family protein [Mailhella massiliensis]